MAALTITRTTPTQPAVNALLDIHAAYCCTSSPPESCHFLPAAALDAPEITLWAAWDGGEIAGVGALKALSKDTGEIKSMHTAAAKRGRGVGGAILTEIEAEAARRAYRSLWLETGTMDAFATARALYERRGFAVCPPFADYRPDPNSVCYTKSLVPMEALQ